MPHILIFPELFFEDSVRMASCATEQTLASDEEVSASLLNSSACPEREALSPELAAAMREADGGGDRLTAFGYPLTDMLRLFCGPGRLSCGGLLLSAGLPDASDGTADPLVYLAGADRQGVFVKRIEGCSPVLRMMFISVKDNDRGVEAERYLAVASEILHRYAELCRERSRAACAAGLARLAGVYERAGIYFVPHDPDSTPAGEAERYAAWQSQSGPMLRRDLRRCLYAALSQELGREFPWGSLTGIRPQYIAAELLAGIRMVSIRNRDGNETLRAAENEALHADQHALLAADIMTRHYGVAPDKAALAVEVARREEEIRRLIPASSVAVYVGIPFCPSRCAYCSFSTQEGIAAPENLREDYLDALIHSIQKGLGALKPRISMVYIGGGTPVTLSPAQLERLMAALEPYLDRKLLVEYCLEAGRADVFRPEHMLVARKYGLRRVCINPQTMNPETLKLVNRPEQVEEVNACFHRVRELMQTNVNMDLIAGLPGEKCADFEHSLRQLIALKPENITIHSLASKRSSSWGQDRHMQNQTAQTATAVFADRLGRPDGETAAMLTLSEKILRRAGYQPYYMYRQKDGVGGLENVGWCLPGTACIYNVAMMSDLCSIMAFGAGAMNKYVYKSRCERLRNIKSIPLYCRRIEEQSARQMAFFEQGGKVT